MDNDPLGFVALGGTLYGMLLTRNASKTPVDADSQPTYTIYGPDGAMTNGTGTTASVAGQDGLYDFSHSISSGDGYAAGVTYTIVQAWEFSSVAASVKQTFTVV